ncbi:MAG: response regulator transcription factor [Bacteroidetes bacterium]|nr:response regulator transcription factor [Bacteroidota bacterium]
MNVIIIEDEDQIRADMTAFMQLQPGYRVHAFDSISAFIDFFKSDTKVDLILLDVMLHQENSLHHLFKIKRLVPDAKILIVTGSNAEAFLFKAIQEGADGYYLKGSDIHLLQEAIQHVLKNSAFVDPAMTRLLLKPLKSRPQTQSASIQPELQYFIQNYDLNKREIEVLTGLSEGLRYKEIADQFHVSINTVRHYVLTLYRKAGVNNRKGLLKKLKALR